uniref:Putative secreted salivary protein salp15ir-2 n=1 Tax=Ixodes ricinus TaxID=34613 RepID=V5GXM0_IXORI
MKVVCITVLFVIVAVDESATSEARTSSAAKETKKRNVTLHFPSYIRNPQKLALELWKFAKITNLVTPFLPLITSAIKRQNNVGTYKETSNNLLLQTCRG